MRAQIARLWAFLWARVSAGWLVPGEPAPCLDTGEIDIRSYPRNSIGFPATVDGGQERSFDRPAEPLVNQLFQSVQTWACSVLGRRKTITSVAYSRLACVAVRTSGPRHVRRACSHVDLEWQGTCADVQDSLNRLAKLVADRPGRASANGAGASHT